MTEAKLAQYTQVQPAGVRGPGLGLSDQGATGYIDAGHGCALLLGIILGMILMAFLKKGGG